jgi:adenine-specific DNA-methyltransferase
MIKYIGSKRALLPAILRAATALCPPGGTVADLFSGTARVGHAFKRAGFRVVANDHNAYAHALATCYVQADAERWAEPARCILEELARLPGRPGYFTATFCEGARYLQPHNGARVDAIRDAIEALAPEPELKAVLLVALMEAADRVDSTAGLQMAYMKRWAKRSFNDLELRLPALLPRPAAGACLAMQGEAEAAAPRIEADLVYLDPPYNQHSYLGNYHVWETLVRWDAPEAYGVAQKRADVRARKSAFNSRRGIQGALQAVLDGLRCRTLLLSFSDEGFLSRATLEGMLRARGHVAVASLPHGRYVGAKIGIYDPSGRRVGTPGHLTNTEFLYVVAPGAAQAERAAAAAMEFAAAA